MASMHKEMTNDADFRENEKHKVRELTKGNVREAPVHCSRGRFSHVPLDLLPHDYGGIPRSKWTAPVRRLRNSSGTERRK